MRTEIALSGGRRREPFSEAVRGGDCPDGLNVRLDASGTGLSCGGFGRQRLEAGGWRQGHSDAVRQQDSPQTFILRSRDIERVEPIGRRRLGWRGEDNGLRMDFVPCADLCIDAILQPMAIWLVVAGCLVHGWGMVRGRLIGPSPSRRGGRWVTMIDVASWIAIAAAAVAVALAAGRAA